MKNYFKNLWNKNKTLRRLVGVVLVTIGIISIITPFTPFGILLVFGLELLGVRMLFWDKIKNWYKKK